MSSSFLERRRLRAAVLAAMLAPAGAFGAQVYLQPIATLTAETNSNLDLDPGPKTQVQGYAVDAATIIGIAAPNAELNLKPRAIYRYYPKESANNLLEAQLDMNGGYRTQRGTASFGASIQRLDEFNAELTQAVYNDFAGTPTIIDTGKVAIGAVRYSQLYSPKYVYGFTPVLSGGVAGQYQAVNYAPAEVTNHVDFYFYAGRAFLTWAYNPILDISLGAYESRYELTHFRSRTKGTGTTLDFDTNWTPLFTTKAQLVYQHTDIKDVVPLPFVNTVNAWGATVSAIYKTQLETFRLDAGRSISPSGGGAVYDVDKLQFQYDRNLTARVQVTGALVGLRTHALTSNIVASDRKYVQTVVEVNWLMTPTWFLQGGYQYGWQRYQVNQASAANNRIYIQVGYKGLAPQR